MVAFERIQQRGFDPRRRGPPRHARGEQAQGARHFPLVHQARGAARAIASMRRGGPARGLFRPTPAGQVSHDGFEFSAVHGAHLAGLMARGAAGAGRAGSNRPASIRRARCNRDLTVPIAQPSASAASA